MVVKAERFGIVIPSGGTTVDTSHILAEGTRIKHIVLGYDTTSNAPPVRLSVELEFFDRPDEPHHHLVGGWVRSSSVPTHMNDIVWDGDLKVKDQTRLRIVGANNTGSDQRVYCYIMTEREDEQSLA